MVFILSNVTNLPSSPSSPHTYRYPCHPAQALTPQESPRPCPIQPLTLRARPVLRGDTLLPMPRPWHPPCTSLSGSATRVMGVRTELLIEEAPLGSIIFLEKAFQLSSTYQYSPPSYMQTISKILSTLCSNYIQNLPTLHHTGTVYILHNYPIINNIHIISNSMKWSPWNLS